MPINEQAIKKLSKLEKFLFYKLYDNLNEIVEYHDTIPHPASIKGALYKFQLRSMNVRLSKLRTWLRTQFDLGVMPVLFNITTIHGVGLKMWVSIAEERFDYDKQDIKTLINMMSPTDRQYHILMNVLKKSYINGMIDATGDACDEDIDIQESRFNKFKQQNIV